MPVVLIVLLVIGAILVAVAWCHITADLHYKENKLTVVISNWFVRKKIDIDFSKEKGRDKPKTEKQEKKNPLKEKIQNAKQRVFTENGFNLEEAKKVKRELFEVYYDALGIIRDFLGRLRLKIHIPKLFVKLDYGTGDPADTGMLYGAIWGAVGVLYPPAARFIHLAYPTLDITPDFYGKRFELEVRSIIKVRPAHIINASFSTLMGLFFTYLKNKINKGSGKDGR